jgi:hypothetical protein
MKPIAPKPQRCAIYARKLTEHNLDLEFNSLDAQREACEAYIKSQAHEGLAGWLRRILSYPRIQPRRAIPSARLAQDEDGRHGLLKNSSVRSKSKDEALCLPRASSFGSELAQCSQTGSGRMFDGV